MAYIHSYNCVTPLGTTVRENVEALLQGQVGIQFYPHYESFSDIYLSKISMDTIEDSFPYISATEQLSFLEKMLLLAAVPLLPTIRITENTVFILSTTKGNISQLNSQMDREHLPYLTRLAKSIAGLLGIRSEPIVVSNACVSGVMALSVADRLLESGQYDNALVVAADEISSFVLSGFQSFQAVSPDPCRPYDKERTGITLGEAAAAAFLSMNPMGASAQILGSSSINDANHISGPSRTGEGLYLSVCKALAQAGITPEQLQLINAHGTGTLYNDEMEAIGHTLGASGLLETLLTIALSKRGKLLQSKGYTTLGVSQPIKVLAQTQSGEVTHFLKTASGFGGSNTAIVVRMRV